jgi:asparagine synthase (glutamine-hydrolysing)
MCGIAGFFDRHRQNDETSVLRAMGEAISYRGPDDSGMWQEREAGVGFVHRRLAIVDLSDAGHQPMVSPQGRYVIVFNGEIYNHQALRHVLETEAAAPQWRGHSDTETLLAAFEAWGVVDTLRSCVGMFAFALWDRQTRELLLARDRMGEKPLYYGHANGHFLFASELKALKAYPSFHAQIDRDALDALCRRHYIAAPRTIYRNIHKLMPGTVLTVSSPEAAPRITPYWSIERAAARGKDRLFSGDAATAVDALESLMQDAIALQMVADVPVGAFLSGGIDSSAIVALMQQQSSRPIKTFTIGFSEDQFNEAPFARDVARHLGTDHVEHYVSPQDALNVIPTLPQLYDEPLADISQIPTYLVSKVARSAVTVSLSGDAGDELFGGYTTYSLAERFLAFNQRWPLPLRTLGALALKSGVPFASMAGQAAWSRRLGHAASVIAAPDARSTLNRLTGHWSSGRSPVLGSALSSDSADAFDSLPMSDLERMMARDMVTYLPDDILAKVDRAAMAVSLETRVPLLDHRIVEFALSLPMDLRRRDGVGKWILREVLYRHVPRSLVDRPKRGFGVPLAEWLRGPLKDWANDLLSAQSLHKDGLFEARLVRAALDDHLTGRRDRHNDLWPVLVATQWMRA